MSVFRNGRERPADYIQICNNTADQYPDGCIPHGVQKDAIQNAIDAVIGKKTLLMEFKLLENVKGRFLTMTDSNTTGLTGPVVTDLSEYEVGLPEDYHWARFEAFAVTKVSPDAIGARGQGKFIFLSASKSYTMYYDTFRKDGVYRVGATKATHSGSPIYPGEDEDPWEGERGTKKLEDLCGLLPLETIGARVIIVDPIEELIEWLEDGQFICAIEETWCRAIEKKRIDVTVDFFGNQVKASVPAPHPLPSADSRIHKVWKLGKDFKDNELRLTTGESYKVKQFHAAFLPSGTVPEELQGIAIIHNGMKITSLHLPLAPWDIQSRITGYIEFDKDLDRELRKPENQYPNHYDLKWRHRLPRAIKDYVISQLDTFGKEKLGLGATDPREIKKRIQSNAEDWATKELIKYADDLDLFGAKGIGKKKNGRGESITKYLGLTIADFTFPEPDLAPRVNWGHSITGFNVVAFNRTKKTRVVYIRAQIFHADTIISELVDTGKLILGQDQIIKFGPFELDITPNNFPEPGRYRLYAALFDGDTGDRIDKIVKTFWVQKDPKFRRPFEWDPVEGFPEPNQYRQWMISGGINKSPVLHYSTLHPAYRDVEEEEEELNDYMFQISLEAAMSFVLDRPNKEDGDPDYHPLDRDEIIGNKSKKIDREQIPRNAYEEIMRYISKIKWKLLGGA